VFLVPRRMNTVLLLGCWSTTSCFKFSPKMFFGNDFVNGFTRILQINNCILSEEKRQRQDCVSKLQSLWLLVHYYPSSETNVESVKYRKPQKFETQNKGGKTRTYKTNQTEETDLVGITKETEETDLLGMCPIPTRSVSSVSFVLKKKFQEKHLS